ncbi:SixA phosphatase family protein [Marichromatium bheemlicum]|uniref:Histidine phosphatase family protein n=1 Tax=Marichromatium bheemlicum TaxID=365339 RepID=A0ABX1I7P8_9GAMM|nr:histidine phosphatase family protein [Marichromatium bheemlicum]NKN32944.1 histidine phosphatase family protein [Marichromatium bheemlicum]
MSYPDPFRTQRELLILRHAKSDWDSGTATDFARPLAKRGRRDAPRIGAWLYREGLVPDQIISSPAERARQTALLVCRCLDLDRRCIRWAPEVYEAGLNTLLETLARCPQPANTVLLVGHNPGLEQLLRYLAGDDLEPPEKAKLLPTAAVARLEMPADWSVLEPGCAHLLALTRPRQLAD